MSCGDIEATSTDAFLGGRVRVAQPRRGHRSGLEAVLIAAACPLRPGQTVLDLGAGAGAAAICALARVPGSRAILVEAASDAAALARDNLERNDLSSRAEVREAEIGGAAVSGLSASCDHAIANPPFHQPGRHRASPTRSGAHQMAVERLEAWVRLAAGAVRGRGTLTSVHRADALAGVLAAFGGRFGAVAVLPLHPRPGRPATRVLVQGIRGARGPLRLLPGLTLHGETGHGFAPAVEAILRDGAPLAMLPDTRDTKARERLGEAGR